MRKPAIATIFAALLAATLGLAEARPQIEVHTLRAPAPSWWTPELRARVVAAGAKGVPLPATAKIPTSSLAYLGIRPGQLIILDDGESSSLCTSNFVFTTGPAPSGILAAGTASGTGKQGSTAKARKGSAGSTGGSTFSIGTAGHCGRTGTDVFMVFAPLGLARIGSITKSTGDPGNRLAPDFALISIAPAFNQYVSPSMAHWGGPTGVYTGKAIQPVQHTGWGLVVGTGGTPRAGVAYQWGDEWRFEGVIAPGDSGSAAIVAGGLGAGNITHIAVDTRAGVPAWMGGTSLVKILSLVGGLKLATCARPIPWPLPGCPPV